MEVEENKKKGLAWTAHSKEEGRCQWFSNKHKSLLSQDVFRCHTSEY